MFCRTPRWCRPRLCKRPFPPTGPQLKTGVKFEVWLHIKSRARFAPLLGDNRSTAFRADIPATPRAHWLLHCAVFGGCAPTCRGSRLDRDVQPGTSQTRKTTTHTTGRERVEPKRSQQSKHAAPKRARNGDKQERETYEDERGRRLRTNLRTSWKSCGGLPHVVAPLRQEWRSCATSGHSEPGGQLPGCPPGPETHWSRCDADGWALEAPDTCADNGGRQRKTAVAAFSGGSRAKWSAHDST